MCSSVRCCSPPCLAVWLWRSALQWYIRNKMGVVESRICDATCFWCRPNDFIRDWIDSRPSTYYLNYLENNCTVVYVEFTPPPILAQSHLNWWTGMLLRRDDQVDFGYFILIFLKGHGVPRVVLNWSFLGRGASVKNEETRTRRRRKKTLGREEARIKQRNLKTTTACTSFESFTVFGLITSVGNYTI